MPPPKRVVSARGRPDLRDDESSPSSSPRRRINDAYPSRGDKGRFDSPSKSPHVGARRPLTSEDVRAGASPIVPRGRGRPAKIPPVDSLPISDYDASPSRRSRRFTDQSGGEDMASPSRSRLDSRSSIISRGTPTMSPMVSYRGRKKSEMEPEEEPSEGVGFDEASEGRGKRKRKLTEAAEAAQAQSRSRKTSRRISERTEQHLDEMDPILEELTEPIDDEQEGEQEEFLDEVSHEEMVHAGSPQEMYMQHHMPVRPMHSMMGVQRTRGMHVVTDHDDELDQQLVEEEHAIEEMVVYDEEGNMIMDYEGEEEMEHEVIEEGDEEEMMMHHDPRRQHIIQPHEGHGVIKEEPQHPQEGQGEEEDDDDDDQPPQLEPEEGPGPEEIMMHENMERGQLEEDYEAQGYIRMQSPGGSTWFQEPPPEDNMYSDQMDAQGLMQQMADGEQAIGQDLRTVEFNFLDNKHICCGMCGEIVPYDNLLREHLPLHHPEVYGEGCDLEEISYDTWLKDKLIHDRKNMENGFRSVQYAEQQQANAMGAVGRNQRILRRVSQVRVNPATMSIAQLDVALKKKMVEKMGRKVKVSLVDKQHARCGICNAVVSLNKKFEVIHLVRHFNAWHPSSHRCAGTWPGRAYLSGPGKPLSSQDFAVVDVALEAPESLQCIWCGMFMDRTMLAMHFHEVHPEDVEVPKCHLCLQEVVINARLQEKYGEDFEIVLPDEHHIRCTKVQGNSFSTEAALDRCIDRRLRRMQATESGEQMSQEEEDEDEENEAVVVDPTQARDAQYSNSRMSFGRRNKPKRNFIMPSLRQAIPQDSRYVEAISEGEWRCKMCGEPILAAVISAGAIKHYRAAHGDQVDDMQYELCKARLERVSDGCMEFVHPQLIECLICNLTYALHKPYNMCRGIRHLKTKHPEMMPEYNRNGEQAATMPATKGTYRRNQQRGAQTLELGDYVEDPAIINKLKQEYDIDFDKVQTMVGPDGQQIFVLVADGQEIDAQIAQNIQNSMMEDAQPVEEEEEGDGEEGEEGEEGVIVEEEEYQMDDEILVQRDDVDEMAADEHTQEIGMEEEVVEEEEVAHERGEEEMGEELQEEEEELVEEDGPEEGQYQ